MVVLNLDNSETRRIVENCYRTQKTLINPLIDWDDDFLYWYIRKENIELSSRLHLMPKSQTVLTRSLLYVMKWRHGAGTLD